MASAHFGPQHWRKSSQWFAITRPAGEPRGQATLVKAGRCPGIGSCAVLFLLHSAMLAFWTAAFDTAENRLSQTTVATVASIRHACSPHLPDNQPLALALCLLSAAMLAVADAHVRELFHSFCFTNLTHC
jgi:hypothetical protein